MELKLGLQPDLYTFPALLIVPYGIETLLARKMRCVKILLIVPYGIETWKKRHWQKHTFTFNRTLWN